MSRPTTRRSSRGSDDSYVGRVVGADEGMTEETGAEARAAGSRDNDPVEG